MGIRVFVCFDVVAPGWVSDGDGVVCCGSCGWEMGAVGLFAFGWLWLVDEALPCKVRGTIIVFYHVLFGST